MRPARLIMRHCTLQPRHRVLNLGALSAQPLPRFGVVTLVAFVNRLTLER